MYKKAMIFIGAVALSSCATMPVQMGTPGSKSPATGAVAGANSQNANSQLERCTESLGTMAVYENAGSSWYGYMSSSGFHSTIPVIRLLAQQSNCFVVVDRGRGLRQAKSERSLNSSGELRQGSNFGKGQMVAADYTITPSLTFSDKNSGGLGAMLGGTLGSVGAIIGGNLRFKSAQSVLTLVDNRSTVQVAAAEGSAKGTDLGGLLGAASSTIGGLGAYTKTPQGKVIVGSIMDAYNNLVRAVRNYQPQAPTAPGGHGTGGKLKVN